MLAPSNRIETASDRLSEVDINCRVLIEKSTEPMAATMTGGEAIDWGIVLNAVVIIQMNGIR